MRSIFAAVLLGAVLALAAVPASAEILQEITVKDGDTLWGVANFYLKDPQRWPEILKHNSLPSSDSSVILPGMKLRIPILLIKEHLRAAHLVQVMNEVRYRRRKDAEWKKAWADMELYNEDGLRTLQQSKAKVKFPSGETLQMDENSLIILKPEKKQEEIDLLSGGVRSSRTRVLTSDSVIDPRIEPRGPAPDFRTKLKEDKTTLVEVYEGMVDVTAEGKTVTVTKGFGTEVKFKQAPSLPKALPPRPEMKLASSTVVPGTDITASGTVRSGALKLDITAPGETGALPSRSRETQNRETRDAAPEKDAKSAKSSAQVLTQMVNKYRIQVSTGHAFSSLVLDETHLIKDGVNIDFKKNQLPDGVYYYRLAYMDELGFEGQFSTPISFTVDTAIPVITVTTPENEQEVDTEFVHIEGRTEPNSTLKVNGKIVLVDEAGNFQTAIMPKNGRNTVSFAAEDRAGNLGQASLVIDKVKTAHEKKKVVLQTEEKKKPKGLSFASLALGTLTAMVIVGVLILLVRR